MLKRFISILLVFLAFTVGSVFAATHYLTQEMVSSDPLITPDRWTPAAVPGDTIIISASSNFRLHEFHGTPSNSYIFTNPPDSRCSITTQDYVWYGTGLKITSSEHFKFIGNNSADEYGFYIDGAGLRLFQCSDWEISHVEILDGAISQNNNEVPGAPWTEEESMGDCKLHDFYIHDVTFQEGVYLGYSHVGNQPKFNTIEVYDFLITNTNWEAIQIEQVSQDGWVKLHDGVIINASRANEDLQNKGFNLGVECGPAEVYNIYLDGCTGHGFYRGSDSWTSEIDFHDNYIANWGQQDPDAIGVRVGLRDGTTNHFSNNIIVGGSDARDGIKLAGGAAVVDGNIIIQPGRYGIYNDGTDLTYSDNIIGDPGSAYVFGNPTDGGGNILEADVADIGFAAWSDDGDYSNDIFSFSSGDKDVYYVEPDDDVVDGDTFCDGKCTSDDTIIIRAGIRADLKLRDFDGDGNYIVITNEDTSSNIPVNIKSDGSTASTFSLINPQWVDLRGDGDPDVEYGFKLENNHGYSHMLWVYPTVLEDYIMSHVKLSYFDISSDPLSGTGITTIYGAAHNTVMYEDFEVHHNYVHDTGYAGMYLGQNAPWNEDLPYIRNYIVHDNVLENMGCYGITLKGVHWTSRPIEIYDNTVRTTGVDCSTDMTAGASFRQGIGVGQFETGPYAKVYGNRIEKTAAMGIKMNSAPHKVYNNTILGCGTQYAETYGDKWAHGIVTYDVQDGQIRDNIILQSGGNGISTLGSCENITLSGNLVGDSYLDGWAEKYPGTLVMDDGNVYHENVEDFGFQQWSDDGDYSNDIFLLGCLSLEDLVDKVNQWLSNQISFEEVIQAVNDWSSC